MDDELWRDRYVLSSLITNPGERAALYRAAQRGRFTCVVRGVYVETSEWARLGVEERHLARMRAIELLRPGTVFSHVSAALAWGLPVVAADLAVPHSVVTPADGGRSMNALVRHTIGIPEDVRVVGGLHVTSPEDTAVQMAMTARPETSVPLLDALLAEKRWQVESGRLAERVAAHPGWPGAARGTWAVEFADPRSGSPGESMSRVTMWRLRLPAPELQCRFDDRLGLIGFVDFWWPEFRLVGEFDGLGKYLREEMRPGKDIAQVVIEEKRREDRLRARDTRVARWGWDEARSPSALRRILLDGGLRVR